MYRSKIIYALILPEAPLSVRAQFTQGTTVKNHMF
jgi:hypothetical protein